jgi:alpha-1,2-mannosyltransferase
MGTTAPTIRRGELRRAIVTRPRWVAAAIGVLTIGTMIVIAVGIGGPMKDLEVYLLAGRAFGRGADIYAAGFGHALATPLPYTYPPSWAAALSLVAWLPGGWLGLGWTILNVALLLWVTRVSYRAFLDGQGAAGGRARLRRGHHGVLGAGAERLDLGQVGILLLAMVLADTTRGARLPRGVLVGAATAIKLTPGVFVAYWIATKRWRAAGTAIASAIGIWVVTALLRPDLSHLLAGHRAAPDARRRSRLRDRSIDQRSLLRLDGTPRCSGQAWPRSRWGSGSSAPAPRTAPATSSRRSRWSASPACSPRRSPGSITPSGSSPRPA